MVRRLLGIARLPDVGVSRTLAGMDSRSVDKLRRLNRQQVLQRLDDLWPGTDYLWFRRNHRSFRRRHGGGFQPQEEGQRSYYPLFSAHWRRPAIFDVWHRPGNA